MKADKIQLPCPGELKATGEKCRVLDRKNQASIRTYVVTFGRSKQKFHYSRDAVILRPSA